METGLYYLQTRYYDPEFGRFISPDSTKYLDPTTINGLNLYSYCLNNPVMYNQGVVSVGNTSIDAYILYCCDTLGSIGSSRSNPTVPEWLKIGVGAIPDVATATKYLIANGIHTRFLYSTAKLYMYPILGGTWSRFAKSKAGYGNLVGASLKQILASDARAGIGAIAKSFGKTVGITAATNLVFNWIENGFKFDGDLWVDTAIDTAIGVSAYYLASGTMSLIAAGVALAGMALPGVIVVGGIILLSIGFDWLIRKITGYDK